MLIRQALGVGGLLPWFGMAWDAEGVFGIVPQQVGGDARGLLHGLGHEEGTADPFPSLLRPGVLDLDEIALLVDFDDEGQFLFLETEGRQGVVGVGELALIIVIERPQDHPRTSSLFQAGTSMTPFSRRAWKKRGTGSPGLP